MSKRMSDSPILLFSLILALSLIVVAPALAGDQKEEVKVAKLAKISIKGGLQDALPPVNPFGPTPMYFKRLLNLISNAAEDRHVEALILEVNSPAIGFAKVNELDRALKSFKGSGKKIFGYAESLGMKDLMILSNCDYVAIPESGVVLMPGLSIEAMYMKNFFEKLGIKFLVEHVGDYKSAFEDFSRDSMSDPLREVLNCLLDEFYYTIVSTIAKNRGIEEMRVAKAVDAAILTPQTALKYGLVDAVCYRDQFDDQVKAMMNAQDLNINKKYGRKDKDLDLNNPLVLFSQIMASLTGKEKKESKNPKIALIYASGSIHSGKNQMDPFSQTVSIGSDTLAGAIKDAAADDTVKAIVLRVDSPGGSGLASDIIWHAEMLAKKKKPFIVSMADVAGSGGYYISMAADLIMAEPGTITGSIGVVSALPNANETLNKLGINLERLSRGRNAGLMSVMAPPEEVNLKLLADYMKAFYWDFVDKVAAGRGMTREAVHKIAQGRVWTGRQALENGLVDALGGLDDAIQIAKIKAGLTDEMDWELKEMPETPDFFTSLMESSGARTLLAEYLKAAGLNPVEALLLEQPEVKALLARLSTILKISREDQILLLMPADIQVRF